MSNTGGITAWDWAGIGGGVAAAFAAFRKLIGWLDTRSAKARRTRAEGLQEWEDKLARREAAIDTDLEHRLTTLEADSRKRAEENVALRLAFEIVGGELRRLDPGSTALQRAEQILATAFPLPRDLIPADMGAQLRRISEADTPRVDAI